MEQIMRRFLVAGLGATALLIATAGPALGSDNYGVMPGASISASHTICSGHGSFGAFGKVYNFGSGIVNLGGAPTGPNGVGASGTATGANNSGLCGNS